MFPGKIRKEILNIYKWAPHFLELNKEPLNDYLQAENSTDIDGIITEYIWTFGDGSTGYGKTTTHKYDEPGTYIVELTVEDNNGASDTVSTLVTIEQKTPGFEIFFLIIAKLNILYIKYLIFEFNNFNLIIFSLAISFISNV